MIYFNSLAGWKAENQIRKPNYNPLTIPHLKNHKETNIMKTKTTIHCLGSALTIAALLLPVLGMQALHGGAYISDIDLLLVDPDGTVRCYTDQQ